MQYTTSLRAIFDTHLASQSTELVVNEYTRIGERLFKQRTPVKAIEMLNASPLLKGRLEIEETTLNNERMLVAFTRDCRYLGGAYVALKEVQGMLHLCSYVAQPSEVQHKYSTILGGKMVEKASTVGQTFPLSFHLEGSKTFIQLNTDRCDVTFWQHQVARLKAIAQQDLLSQESRAHLYHLLALCSTALP